MEQALSKTRVLVVEDEIVVSEDLQQRLLDLGFEVVGAADTANDAIRMATSMRPDVALMDIMLHGRSEGIDAAEHLRSELDIPIIYLTAHSDSATLERARLTDPAGYIVKPFEQTQLRVAIELAPHRHRMEQKVRQIARWLTAVLTSIGDSIITTNNRAEITMLNPSAQKLLGWTQDEAQGKPCGEVLRLKKKESGQFLDDPATNALRHGVAVRLGSGTLLVTRDGEERHVDDSAAPIIDEAGNVLGAVVVLVDASVAQFNLELRDEIAERERVEEALRHAKAAAEASIHELEAFSYSVAHDLRAPLRSIDGFSRAVLEDCADRLDEEGKKYLQHVCDAARQMGELIDDLLNLSRVTRAELRRERVDLSELARDVLETLQEDQPERMVEVVVQDGLVAQADSRLMRVVLVNLLGNAWKFTGKCASARIEFGAQEGDRLPVFFIRDNGAGFNPAYADKLFGVFQRLHAAQEFDGTGIGLATVQRIVQRHGGRVWATGEVNRGATFYFTLEGDGQT